jgi:DNA polymerase III sliding clamp (beta) subunit (PCNA family)
MTKVDAKIDAKVFKGFISALDLLEDLNFQVGKSGISIREMDPAGISMVEAGLPKAAFSKWEVQEGNMEVNIKNLKSALKKTKKEEILSIHAADDKMKLSLPGKTEVEIPYLAWDDKTSQAPKKNPPEDYTAEAKVQAGQIKEFLDKAKKKSGYALITIKKGKLYLFSKGDLGQVEKEIPIEDGPKKPVSSTFNIDYLNYLFKAAKGEEEVTLHLKTESPLKLTYKIANAPVTYWLAPYLDSDVVKIEKPKKVKEAKKRLKA